MTSTIISLIGLFGGVIFAIVGIYLYSKKAIQKREYDERHKEIEFRSRNASWWITFISLFIIFILMITRVIDSASLIVGSLYAMHLIGYFVCNLIYKKVL